MPDTPAARVPLIDPNVDRLAVQIAASPNMASAMTTGADSVKVHAAEDLGNADHHRDIHDDLDQPGLGSSPFTQ